MKKRFEKEFWLHAVVLTLLALILSVLMNISWGNLPSGVVVGQIATQDIRADKDYTVIDEEETAARREAAINAVLPVFDWDEDANVDHLKIIEDPSDLDPWKDKGIMIRSMKRPDQPRVLIKDFDDIESLEEAKARAARDLKHPDLLPEGGPKVSLFFDEAETKVLREKAAASVEAVPIEVKAGQSIIRSGDPFNARQVKIIEGIRKEKQKTFGRTRLLGTFLFVSVFLIIFFYVLQGSFRKLSLSPKDLVFLGSLLILLIATERAALFVFGAVRGLLPFDIPLSSFYALIPVAFVTMMVRLVLPFPIAMIFVPVSAVLAGFIVQGQVDYTIFQLVSCALGMYLMARVRTRGNILKAGFQLGAVQALLVVVFDMINITTLSGALDWKDGLVRALLAFLGGVINALAVLILMPIFETVFNYLTPTKLLEYGSLNHPLLREMIVRAPGTYHHSHMVGTLAESACDGIGADSLFARVASYFHDIGKMVKAPYFIENQSAAGSEDRHASLSPSMSALIISSHVKDGIELARQHKLPERIIDIIPQHQGTKLITYFYNKAKEREDPDVHVAAERDYRYPGPKPQTREAGVILLADTTEAATRALKDRSPARLEEVVRNMINKNFIDGQLDECELTLKDLHIIAKNFLRVLMGIYHQRVEYPPDEADKAVREETDAGKYSQSKPLREDSLKEITKLPPKNIPRIGGSRSD
jgi:cyclic-di-AMP phosphodiesterase PgpH